MSTSLTNNKTYTAFIKKLAKQSKQLSLFAECLLEHSPESEIVDLIERRSFESQIQDAYGYFTQQSTVQDVNVRIFHCEETPNTIIQTLCSDYAFIVDTIGEEMYDCGYEIHHTFHPVLDVKRSSDGHVEDFKRPIIGKEAPKGYVREAFVHMEIDPLYGDTRIKETQSHITDLISKVAIVNDDFPKMTQQLQALTNNVSTSNTAKHHAEELAFFEWILSGNFIFLGYRKYNISYEKDKTYMALARGKGLGILRKDEDSSVYTKRCLDDVPPNLKHYYSNKKDLVTLTKALTKSPVHRRADMDYIGIKEFDEKGNVICEHRFLGLLTSRAYTTNPRNIPLIRRKLTKVLEKSSLEEASHNHKALVNVLETYPRDELFQITPEDLERISTGIVKLKERQQVRAFIRHSRHELLTTAMIFIPRDRMNSGLRKKIIHILTEAYNAQDVEFITTLGESRLARLFLKIRSYPPETPHVSDAAVEERIIHAARNWYDDLRDALTEKYDNQKGRMLHTQYCGAFRAGYQENNSIDEVIHDIETFEKMASSESNYHINLHTRPNEKHLKVFHKGHRLNLSTVMPTFDKMGLNITDENPTLINEGVDEPIWIHDFGIEDKEGSKGFENSNAVETLKEALVAAWENKIENDSLNKLILGAGLSLGDIVLLRSFVAYLQQIGLAYSKEYMRQTLVKNADIARKLVSFFNAKFDPDLDEDSRKRSLDTLKKEIDADLASVSILDEDTILSRILSVIQAMVRTNAFQRDESTGPLAFKIRSADVLGMPKPCPLFEIFVYHSTIEGVHLRGGKVARGGLRWSDRPEDFRTEVLGLVKAQMTKNAVIVPMGSKGGFIMKAWPEDRSRASVMAAVETVYRTFITSLLSVTDNYVEGKVIHPRHVVRYDESDPYLVVAADKGTATFSDVANGIAANADYWDGVTTGFWLGDAFASGGSNGYDHKKMGITARGAWECVKHHFREMGTDIQEEDFTVVGIGDMGGDVFGNGMLLSKHIRLLAAFNHMHIFVDPNPDAAISWRERQRLFKNPRLTWADYNEDILSKGGEVYDRNAKSITLSSEAQKALGAGKAKMTPDELISVILKAPVDLLWNGGIGTYVKATTESHVDVGDRANDAVRIDAPEVRAKVIGEGGNLGMTQKARIELALNGGCVNTDAIDNSAGVNSSDYEVNIKILLRLAAEKGKIKTSARNKLLEEMTDEVAELSMKANYLQSQTLSLAQSISQEMLEPYTQLMHDLTKDDFLDRALEFLPDDDELENRRRHNTGLTRPESSILMAYAKMDLYNTILASKLPDDSALEKVYLYSYFPHVLVKKYKELMPEHQLKREIIATQVTNDFINRTGLTFLNRMISETGQKACTVVRAYVIAKELFEADILYAEIDALDNKVTTDVQARMRKKVKSLVENAAYWILRNVDDKPLDITTTLERFEKPVMQMQKHIDACLTERMEKHIEQRRHLWIDKGLSDRLARKFSMLPTLHSALDIASISLTSGKSVKAVMQLHYEVGETFSFDTIHAAAQNIPVTSNWERVGVLAIADQLYNSQKQLTLSIFKHQEKSKAPNVSKWVVEKHGTLDPYQEFIEAFKAQPEVSHASLNVALSRIKGLIRN